MKLKSLIVFLFFSYLANAQSRYDLLDHGSNKFFLADSIAKLAQRGQITKQPIVVINGIPFRYQDLEKQKLHLSKPAIAKINAIDKQKAIAIYSNYGEAGVLIITTTGYKTILLDNNDDEQYYLIDKINAAYDSGAIVNSPIIVIDGVPYSYDKKENTIRLPLKKETIQDINFVEKSTSSVLYGAKETSGAILITTTN